MFEFITLLLSASAIAVIGLSTNNTIIVVSAMLISPLMTPLVSITNGIINKKKNLIVDGLKLESIGICLSLVTGYIGGLIMGQFFIDTWPNQEMIDRTLIKTLLLSIFIAIFSSFAVGIKIINDDVGSTIGTAISTSILPPAINSGILFSYCTIKNDSYYIEGSFISFGISILNIVIIIAFSTLTVFVYESWQNYKLRNFEV